MISIYVDDYNIHADRNNKTGYTRKNVNINERVKIPNFGNKLIRTWPHGISIV